MPPLATLHAPQRPPGVGISTNLRQVDPLVAVLGLTVALLPFLNPAGPGNTAPADVGIIMSIVLAVLWITREQLPFKLPYAAGVGGLVLGGALAAAVSSAPVGSALVIVQDLLLLAWCAVLALGRHNPAIIGVTTRAWCLTAAIYSGVMVFAYLLGINAVAGVSAKDGVRAAYTFGDPNLAGNYLVVSLFMMAACKRPRSPGIRRVGYVLVLTAIVFTGSNGAMLTLLIGSTLAFALTRYRRYGARDGVTALAVSALLGVVIVGVVIPRVDLDQLREHASGSIPLLRDSVGRSGSSTGERTTIVSEGAKLYLQGDATGYGPARTKATLRSTQAPYVKEAHNDYLATLLERGFVGAVGLLLLGIAILVRCGRLAFGTLPTAYAEAVPRAWLLAVIGPVVAGAASFYEVLHFRHLWTWLGIVAALVYAMQNAEGKKS
jgi:O-antigen ligase